MEVVIDAQVVKGYFQEAVLGMVDSETELTGSAIPLFKRLSTADKAFVDNRKQIEAEWGRVVGDREWFRAWYIGMLDSEAVLEIAVDTCNSLLKTLQQKAGFPNTTRDVWYVRVAVSVVQKYGTAVIISEDMHFFDPRNAKSSPVYRQRTLATSSGPMCKALDKEAIKVRSVAKYLEEVI